MRDDKRRIALEAIAYGDNTPPEARLRAIDALRALDDEPERRDFWTELEAMDDAELDRLYDGLASDTESRQSPPGRARGGRYLPSASAKR